MYFLKVWLAYNKPDFIWNVAALNVWGGVNAPRHPYSFTHKAVCSNSFRSFLVYFWTFGSLTGSQYSQLIGRSFSFCDMPSLNVALSVPSPTVLKACFFMKTPLHGDLSCLLSAVWSSTTSNHIFYFDLQ